MPVIAPDIFDPVASISSAQNVFSALQSYVEAGRKVGLGHGLACYTHPEASLAERIFANAMPEGWLAHYSAQNYGSHNPLIERTRRALRPYEWSVTDWNGNLTPILRRLRDDSISAGISHGICVPNLARADGKAIYLLGPSDDIHPQDRATLYLAGVEVLLRMRELQHDTEPPPPPSLSAREAECLKWVAAGKSDWEIGAILSLSEKTVNIYVERAKHKLGVPTRAQAAVMAVRSGLIGI